MINSKQRPRKLTIYGSDGHEYQFLLKGHEDLRQDERVMQLFGLVNNLLAGDRNTVERSLSIARYAVIPLSPNSGLIGWVRNCDTLHALIREYRDSRNIALNIEHRIMQNLAPNYEMMMVIQKVEVFEDALEHTSGDDLHKVRRCRRRRRCHPVSHFASQSPHPRVRAGALAQEPQQRGVARPAHQLHALHGRHEHGGLPAGPRRPPPL